MLANQERQAVARRLFDALREDFPDRYVTLIVVVVASLAFGAFLIAFLLPQTPRFRSVNLVDGKAVHVVRIL
jgi:hypothetical protein